MLYVICFCQKKKEGDLGHTHTRPSLLHSTMESIIVVSLIVLLIWSFWVQWHGPHSCLIVLIISAAQRVSRYQISGELYGDSFPWLHEEVQFIVIKKVKWTELWCSNVIGHGTNHLVWVHFAFFPKDAISSFEDFINSDSQVMFVPLLSSFPKSKSQALAITIFTLVLANA